MSTVEREWVPWSYHVPAGTFPFFDIRRVLASLHLEKRKQLIAAVVAHLIGPTLHIAMAFDFFYFILPLLNLFYFYERDRI